MDKKKLENLKKLTESFPKGTGLFNFPILPQLLTWLEQLQKILEEILEKKEEDTVIAKALTVEINILSYFLALMSAWSLLTKENILTMSAESLSEFINSIKLMEHKHTENADKIDNFLSDLEFLLEKTDGHKDN